jgi:hypothetical protein
VKLTSKNIKSQSFTIELLDNLIQNIGQDIPNNKLPLSSYSTDRNQITGKIIIPFTRLANEIFGENIKIKCHGEN